MNLEEFLTHFQKVIYIVIGIMIIGYFLFNYGNYNDIKGYARAKSEDFSIMVTLCDDLVKHGSNRLKL